MAVNQYSQPAQHKFIQTYVPVPFEELSQAAAARQGKYDENASRVDNAQLALNNLEYIPNSKDQATVERWRSELSNFADEFIDQDYSDPEVYRKIRSGIKQIVDPADVQRIQQSTAGYKDYMKQSGSMQAKGQQVYNPQDFTGYDSLGDQGIFVGQPIMDRGDEAAAAVDEYLKRPQSRTREEFSKESGRWLIKGGRDINEIYALIDSEKDSAALLNNPDVQQLIEKMGVDETGFREYLKKLAPSYATEQIKSASYPPRYNDDTTDRSPRPTFVETPSVPTGEVDIANVDRDRNIKFDGTGYSVEADISLDSFIPEQRDEYLNIRSDYQTKIDNIYGEIEANGNKPLIGEGRRQEWRKQRRNKVREVKNLYKERNDKLREYTNKEVGDFKETVSNITEAYPVLTRGGSASEQQIWDGYNQIMDDIEQISVPAVSMSAAQRKAWAVQLADQANFHSMFIEDALGKSEAPTGINDTDKGSVLNEVGMNGNEFMTALRDPNNNDVNVAGFSVGQGSEPGQIILSVADTKKKDKNSRRTVYISTTLTSKEYLRPIQNVYSQIKSGKKGFIKLGYAEGIGEVGVQIVPQTSYNEVKDIFNYDPILLRGGIKEMADGTMSFTEGFEPVSYQELTEEFLYGLFESGTLGANMMDKGSTSATQ